MYLDGYLSTSMPPTSGGTVQRTRRTLASFGSRDTWTSGPPRRPRSSSG